MTLRQVLWLRRIPLLRRVFWLEDVWLGPDHFRIDLLLFKRFRVKLRPER